MLGKIANLQIRSDAVQVGASNPKIFERLPAYIISESQQAAATLGVINAYWRKVLMTKEGVPEEEDTSPAEVTRLSKVIDGVLDRAEQSIQLANASIEAGAA